MAKDSRERPRFDDALYVFLTNSHPPSHLHSAHTSQIKGGDGTKLKRRNKSPSKGGQPARASLPRRGAAQPPSKGGLAPVKVFFYTICLLTMTAASFLLGEATGESGAIDQPTRAMLRGLVSGSSRSSPTASLTDAEAESRLNLDESDWPPGWGQMSLREVVSALSCKEVFDNQDNPLPSIDDWTVLRYAYTRVVDPRWTFDDPVPPTAGYSFHEQYHEPPPYVARMSPGKGRGLFATRRIREGELVHRGGNQGDVEFTGGGDAWRRYMFSLPRPLACQIASWNWTQKTEEDGDLRHFVSLNIASLMNTGGENIYGVKANVRPEPDRYSLLLHAKRDIEEGEEILMNYGVYETNWRKVGL